LTIGDGYRPQADALDDPVVFNILVCQIGFSTISQWSPSLMPESRSKRLVS